MPEIPQEISRLELFNVLQAVADGVSIANSEGRIIFSNDAANRILGIGSCDKPPEGWADHYGVYVPGTDIPFPEESYPLVRALAGEELSDVVMRIRNPARPHDVIIQSSAKALRAPHGSITGAVVVFRDITALTAAQQGLEQINAQLEATDKLRDELTAFVAHDLKGPLTTVMALSDLVLMDDGQELPAIRSDVAEIKAAAERMHRMVMDLLDVQLGEDGRLKLKLEAVRLRDLADAVAAAIRPRASGIIVEGIDETLTVCADKPLLYRVLANLVDNCVKYGPSSGRISIGASRADGQICITIEDEGPGVPEDLREEIFDKYAQVERSRAGRSTDSRGLGLRFCRVIVEAHGGRIHVEDAEPTGARFCVELPAYQA